MTKSIAYRLALTALAAAVFAICLDHIPFEVGVCLTSRIASAVAGILGLCMALGTFPNAFGMDPSHKSFKALSVIGCIAVGFSFAACLAGYTGYGIAAAVDLIAFCCIGISSLNDEKEPR
jgi:urea transporter